MGLKLNSLHQSDSTLTTSATFSRNKPIYLAWTSILSYYIYEIIIWLVDGSHGSGAFFDNKFFYVRLLPNGDEWENDSICDEDKLKEQMFCDSVFESENVWKINQYASRKNKRSTKAKKFPHPFILYFVDLIGKSLYINRADDKGYHKK